MSAAASLVLFDDEIAAAFHPFTLTRPAGELLFGAFTFRERAQHVFGARCIAHIAAESLHGFDEPGAAPVVTATDIPQEVPRWFLLSRAVPLWSARPVAPSTPAVITADGTVIGWFAPAGAPGPVEEFFRRPDAMSTAGMEIVELPARVIANVWELVTRNAAQLLEDFEKAPGPPITELPAHVPGADGGRVTARAGENVEIEPGVVIDTRGGPVWFGDNVTVRALTRIAGPAWFGAGTTVLGGSLTAVSVGPCCKVRGELEESVVLGYTNKAHDGFIGHSYLGRWVNLGALTTNSDLKNNYSTVRIWTPNGECDTGERKIGCFLGDHVKTAIGTLLNTGTVVGPGGNLFGSGMPPKYVRPFSWGGGMAVHELTRFLDTARYAMSRRGEQLTPGVERVLRRLWQNVAGETS